MKKISYSKKIRYFAIVLICLFTIIAVSGYGVYAVNYLERKAAERQNNADSVSAEVDENHRNEVIDLAEAIVLNNTDKIYYFETEKGYVPVGNLVVSVPTGDEEEPAEEYDYILTRAGGPARYIRKSDKSQTLNTVKLTDVLAVGVEEHSYFNLNLPLIKKVADPADFYTAFVYYTKKIDPTEIITAEDAIKSMGLVVKNEDGEMLVSNMLPQSDMDLPMAVASSILIVILAIFVLVSCGHFGEEEIVLTFFDRLGYALHFAMMLVIGGCCWIPFLFIVEHSTWGENLEFLIPALFFGCIITVLCFGWFVETTVVRFKAKQFWETTVVFYIYSYAKSPIIRFAEWNKEQFLTRKDESNGVDKMIEQTSEIVSGKRDSIDTAGVTPHYLPLAHSINAIASGKSNAVSAQMKSDKMRTELITNVSHDIKTPLTSIISYVDLLSKEDLGTEKAKEYVEVLSRQSLRLKTLLEDLIEASKASSGVLSVNKEEINIGVILNQVSGEYEERFAAKKLSVVTHIPEDTRPVLTDGRHLSRVIGNLYSNIAKYSLEGTRVYVDVVQNDKTVVTIKNTSLNQLNISSDELMERFVRGDESRKTEGSGLGLSIAGSLMKLMGGSLDIEIDGDLFKAILTL